MEILKQKILMAHENGDIATLFTLEDEVEEKLDEKLQSAYYKNILDLAMEKLTDAMEKERKMTLDNVQDVATIRALYEYALEHYSAGQLNDSVALFEILAGLCEDGNFSSSLQIHHKCVEARMDFNDFISDVADLEATQKSGTFYISEFKA
ncbi:MAG: hypothetical protein GQ570_02080 [Helicobacteraceae bacterium]|nr:hypothetical protein [Helicobacteraceae bacterium]